MQSEQDLRNSEAIYDETSKVTGGLLLLLIEAMLKKKLNLEVERVEEQGSGLEIERMDERESGLTVERMDGQGLEVEKTTATSQLEQLAATAKAKQQDEDRNVDEVLQSLEEFANPQPVEVTLPKQEEEVRAKPQLLFGQEDGKPVNRMTDEEITAIAKILTSPKGENVPGGENLRIKYNGVVIAETNAQGEITLNEAYKKLDPQIVKQIEEAISQVPQSKAPEVTPPVATAPKPIPVKPEQETPPAETKPPVAKPVKRTTAEALSDLLESAQSAGANLIAGIVRTVEEHSRPVPKKRGQDPMVSENQTDVPVVSEVAVIEGLTAAEYAANKEILSTSKNYTAYTQITDVHVSRTGQIRDLIEWTAEAATTAELSDVENEFIIKSDRGYLVTCEPSVDGFNYTLMKEEQLMLNGVKDPQKEWVILVAAEGNLETGILKVTNYDADAKKEIAAEIKAMRGDIETFKAIDLPKEQPPAQLMPWQDKGLLAVSQANNLVKWASTSGYLTIPDGETEKIAKSSYRAVEVIATVDGAEASTIAYELRDLDDNKSLTVICEIEGGKIIDINGDVTPLIIQQIDSIEEVLERENAAHIPTEISAQTPQKPENIINDLVADPNRDYAVENTIAIKTAIDKLQPIADEKLGHEESGEIVVDDDRFKLKRYEDEMGVTYEAVGKDGGVIKWEYAKEEDQVFLNHARLSADIQHGVDTLSPETPTPLIEVPTPIKGKDEPVIQMSATERIAAQKMAKEQAKSEPERGKAPTQTQSAGR
jgi:hypothetical protein